MAGPLSAASALERLASIIRGTNTTAPSSKTTVTRTISLSLILFPPIQKLKTGEDPLGFDFVSLVDLGDEV